MNDYNDIPDYAGYCPECPICETIMKFSYCKAEFKCFECGHTMNECDWEDIVGEDESEPPYVCIVCGGPYPQCQTSCKIFDD
jgi:hypothetical protein